MGIEVILAQQSLLTCLATTFDCDWTLLAGQLMQESSGDPNTIGDNGLAYGLCQIHLATAYAHPDLQQMPPARFLEVGVNLQAYILEMSRLHLWLQRYNITDIKMLLATWNWGQGNMQKLLQAGNGYDELPEVVKGYIEKCQELGKEFE